MVGRHSRIEWSIVVVAIAVRVAAIFVLRSYELPRTTFEHGEIAANLLAGRGFSINFLGADGPTSQQAPLYPFIVAGAFAVAGVESIGARCLIQLAQALLAGFLVSGVMRHARRLSNQSMWIAPIAGIVVAIHPTLIYATTHIQVALLAATLLVWTLDLAEVAALTGRVIDSARAGFVLGLLLLVDPILGLVAPAVGWILVRRQVGERLTLAQRAPRVMALGVACALTILPWTIRNTLVHGEFVPIKTTLGYAFWQGNNELSHGTDKVVRARVDEVLAERPADLAARNKSLWDARHIAGYIDDIALTATDRAELGALTEPARSRELARRAFEWIRAHPARYVALCVDRLRYFLLFDETNPKTREPIYRVSQVAITVWGVLGLCLMSTPARRRGAPGIITAALVTLFHALTITSARFHIPLEPLLAIWGAIGFGSFSRQQSTAPADHVERVRVVARRLGRESVGADGVCVR